MPHSSSRCCDGWICRSVGRLCQDGNCYDTLFVCWNAIFILEDCDGTEDFLQGNYVDARSFATIARYLEQYIAVELKHTQALYLYNWPKIYETYYADEHTHVKFLRHRIPCSCLDEKYEEVKHITKMGICYSGECSIRDKYNRVERSKAKYCSRCRCATYCSRECQIADWSRHKTDCDRNAAMIAKFEAKQKNI